MAVDINTFNTKGVESNNFFNKTSNILEFLSSENKAFTINEITAAVNVDMNNDRLMHNFTCLINNAKRANKIIIKNIDDVRHIALNREVVKV